MNMVIIYWLVIRTGLGTAAGLVAYHRYLPLQVLQVRVQFAVTARGFISSSLRAPASCFISLYIALGFTAK
ncbi:hypothetical protein EDC01DRAFT_478947 [Geopyxis carbonaria]|nr:hypothetical protein EDC01DRAFT_478947 [Geopyxis carbonaria]